MKAIRVALLRERGASPFWFSCCPRQGPRVQVGSYLRLIPREQPTTCGLNHQTGEPVPAHVAGGERADG